MKIRSDITMVEEIRTHNLQGKSKFVIRYFGSGSRHSNSFPTSAGVLCIFLIFKFLYCTMKYCE